MSSISDNLTGAIFCGGKSTRMGQRKEMMPLESGISLIEHVYGVVTQSCSKVVLVGNPPQLPPSLQGLDRIKDNFPDIGPLGGMEALLSSGLSDVYLTAPCDLDQLNGRILDLLMTVEGPLPAVLRHKDQIEPLVGLYPTSILPIIRNKIDEQLYSLKGLLHDIPHTEIPVPDSLAKGLNNVNTIHDFKG